MKKLLTLFTVILSASLAKADGFKCNSVDGELSIQIYNQTNPNFGTRNSAVMIISDTQVALGNKTIARFFASEGNLHNEGSKYYANVDERYNNIPGGEYIAGTRISELSDIIIDIDFAYNDGISFGETVEAFLILNFEANRPQTKVFVLCDRYTKHNN